MKFFSKNSVVAFSLLTIIFIGGFMRFYNLNWDQGHLFHPDERNIAMAVTRINFFHQLNPQFFAYGSFPIYLYRLAGEILVKLTHQQRWVYEWSAINLIGRYFSAFFSTFTIFLIFLLSKKIWNSLVGLLAAFLASFSPGLIQAAHFGVTESLLVFWAVLIAIFSFDLAQKPTRRNYSRLGIVLGLAVTTKISALSFFIIPTVAHFSYYFKYLKGHLKYLLMVLLSFLTFSFLSPYAFLDRQKFLESMGYETGVVWGKSKVVYVLQFEKTLPYLFQIKNFFWQMGLMALLGIIGTLVLLLLAIKNKDKKFFIFLSFPIVYFLYAGSWYTKFMRYMVPFLPFLCLAAAWLMLEIHQRKKVIGKTLIAVICLATFLWSLAFFSIYTKESTRITASRWIYQNLSPGAKILGEHWDDGLPIDLTQNHPNQYRIEQLTVYEPDNQQKVNYYAEKLSGADYIIINSRRLYGTLMSLPEKYPVTSQYYRRLFAGELGYFKIAEFSSYPQIFGLKINDDTSEETFQVYDHPKVLIFANQKHLSSQDLVSVLSENDQFQSTR